MSFPPTTLPVDRPDRGFLRRLDRATLPGPRVLAARRLIVPGNEG